MIFQRYYFCNEIFCGKAYRLSTKEKEKNKDIQDAVEKLSEQNKTIRKKNKELSSMLMEMKERLGEINLSNAKLLYTNRTLNSTSLNERQKDKIVESIRSAGTVEEAKVIHETLQSAVQPSQKSGPQARAQHRSFPAQSIQ